MNQVSPSDLFPGSLLLVAPHMDDEVLACGGVLAGLSHKERIHVAYATNGRRSPLQPGWRPSEELETVRKHEARRALEVLGIPPANIHFLDLPDGELRNENERLKQALIRILMGLCPDQILAPFRYDRHPDHLALNRTLYQAIERVNCQAVVYEYFVYHRYRLLRGGDIRAYIRPELCYRVDIHTWSDQKQAALLCYQSQTTRFFEWQRRPIIPIKRVQEVSHNPEIFLRANQAYRGAAVFGKSATWVRLVHALEPRLKDAKEQILGVFTPVFRTNGNKPG